MVEWVKYALTFALIWQVVALVQSIRKGFVSYSGSVARRGDRRYKYEVLFIVLRVIFFTYLAVFSWK